MMRRSARKERAGKGCRSDCPSLPKKATGPLLDTCDDGYHIMILFGNFTQIFVFDMGRESSSQDTLGFAGAWPAQFYQRFDVAAPTAFDATWLEMAVVWIKVAGARSAL